MGSLYDNVQAPLTARFWKNINIGWAGANPVFWNCEGDFLAQKPSTAQNFSFGHIGLNAVIFNIQSQDPTKENGHIEPLDRHVTPQLVSHSTTRAPRRRSGSADCCRQPDRLKISVWVAKGFAVFADLFLSNGRFDAGKHFFDNAVLRPLTFLGL